MGSHKGHARVTQLLLIIDQRFSEFAGGCGQFGAGFRLFLERAHPQLAAVLPHCLCLRGSNRRNFPPFPPEISTPPCLMIALPPFLECRSKVPICSVPVPTWLSAACRMTNDSSLAPCPRIPIPPLNVESSCLTPLIPAVRPTPWPGRICRAPHEHKLVRMELLNPELEADPGMLALEVACLFLSTPGQRSPFRVREPGRSGE